MGPKAGVCLGGAGVACGASVQIPSQTTLNGIQYLTHPHAVASRSIDVGVLMLADLAEGCPGKYSRLRYSPSPCFVVVNSQRTYRYFRASQRFRDVRELR